MNRITRYFLVALLAALATLCEAEDSVIYADGFDEGLAGWEVLDPDTWRANAGGTVEITDRTSEYAPPHRSPTHVALVQGLVIGDSTITFRVKSTLDTGGHRDCCVFFGWQDPAHFYYVHLGAKPDPHSGQIMIVDGADRRAMTENQQPVPWDDDWHKVKLERDIATGRIAVYFDDMTTPLMETTDTTFVAGRIGIGSFDDLNAFDDVRVTVP